MPGLQRGSDMLHGVYLAVQLLQYASKQLERSRYQNA